MQDEARFIMQTTTGLTKENFLADETLKRAIVRSLEVIGEVAPSLREQNPDVPWRAICGMRDRLIHGYLMVNYNVVWDTACHKVPELSVQLQRMIDAGVGE